VSPSSKTRGLRRGFPYRARVTRAYRDAYLDSPLASHLVRDRLLWFCQQHQMRVVSDLNGVLAVEQGSQLKTRLLGGWFVGPESLPKRAQLRCDPMPIGARVVVRIEESLGFGLLDGILKDKYEAYFHDWMMNLAAALGARYP